MRKKRLWRKPLRYNHFVLVCKDYFSAGDVWFDTNTGEIRTMDGANGYFAGFVTQTNGAVVPCFDRDRQKAWPFRYREHVNEIRGQLLVVDSLHTEVESHGSPKEGQPFAPVRKPTKTQQLPYNWWQQASRQRRKWP